MRNFGEKSYVRVCSHSMHDSTQNSTRTYGYLRSDTVTICYTSNITTVTILDRMTPLSPHVWRTVVLFYYTKYVVTSSVRTRMSNWRLKLLSSKKGLDDADNLPKNSRPKELRHPQQWTVCGAASSVRFGRQIASVSEKLHRKLMYTIQLSEQFHASIDWPFYTKFACHSPQFMNK